MAGALFTLIKLSKPLKKLHPENGIKRNNLDIDINVVNWA